MWRQVLTTAFQRKLFQNRFTRYYCEQGRRSVDLSNAPLGFFFDTHSCVKNLEKQGFTAAEAEGIADLLSTVIRAQADSQNKFLVTKTQLEIVVQETLAQISSVKKDMSILEKSEFSNLRHDTEKLSIAMKQLDTKLADELGKLKGGLLLDMNLEKSRAKEEQSKIEKEVGLLTNRIGLEVAQIHTEIAKLRASFEARRTDTIKYIAGTFLSALGLVISIGIITLRMYSTK